MIVNPPTGGGSGKLGDVPRTKIDASNKGLKGRCRNLKKERLRSFNSSSYINVHKMEEDEIDRK